MNDQRTAEVLRQILAILKSRNLGPGGNLPVKVILNHDVLPGVSNSDTLNALNCGVEKGFFTLVSGGVSGMGTITLTDAGYTASRS